MGIAELNASELGAACTLQVERFATTPLPTKIKKTPAESV